MPTIPVADRIPIAVEPHLVRTRLLGIRASNRRSEFLLNSGRAGLGRKIPRRRNGCGAVLGV
jgi:hypothetical protein